MIQNNSYDADTLHEECGVFGMYDFDGADVASTIYYGLFALQHRGQESCGIAVSDTSGPKGKVLSYKGNVFGIEPPYFVELEVTQTDPGFKGDTATNATKPATLETGAEIRVPLFVEIGDIIRIDTRTGEYMERVTNK